MKQIKNTRLGKFTILEEPFSKNGRLYCKAFCNFCHKTFTTQLRYIKKQLGCGCREKTKVDIGQVFSNLTVIEIIDTKTIKCKCVCGSEKTYSKYNILSGNTKSCGCIRIEKLLQRSQKHDLSKSRIYYIYNHMKSRCFNKNSYAYKWYGGKGITICNEWLGENGFTNFYDWANNNGYSDNLSLERIDVNKNYSPQNCTWIKIENQHENTSKTIRIKTDDGVMFVKDFSLKYNIPKSSVYSKIKSLNPNDLTEKNLIKHFKKE